MSGTVVAAMVARARRRLVEHFRAAGAISAPNAIAFTPSSRLIERRMFERMVRFGAIREQDGRYWLDERGLVAFRKETLARVLSALALAGFAAAGAIALGR